MTAVIMKVIGSYPQAARPGRFLVNLERIQGDRLEMLSTGPTVVQSRETSAEYRVRLTRVTERREVLMAILEAISPETVGPSTGETFLWVDDPP